MEGPSLLTRKPNTISLHPLAQRLTRYLEPVMFCQHLCYQSWTEIQIVLFDQGDGTVALCLMDLVVWDFATRLVPDSWRLQFGIALAI